MSVEEYKRLRDGHVKPAAIDIPVVKVDLVDITEKEQWGDRSLITRTPGRHQAKGGTEQFLDYAVILRRHVNLQGKRTATCLEVRSPLIRKGLMEVLGDYPFVNIHSTPIIFSAPFEPLFQFREEIRAYAESDARSNEEKQHMIVLTRFMSKNLRNAELEYAKLLPSGMITYNLLYTIFRPDIILLGQRDYFDECYRVESFEYKEEDPIRSVNAHALVTVRTWNYNGVRFGPATEKLGIDEFAGSKKIKSLDYYPINYYEDKDEKSIAALKEKLIARGHKWRGIVDVSHRSYDSVAWIPPLDPSERNLNASIPKHISGRIILDYKTHEQAHPALATVLAKSGVMATSVIGKQIAEDDEKQDPDAPILDTQKQQDDKYLSHVNDECYSMTDDQALLCPARVRGFSLTEKLWALFLVTEVKPVEWHDNSFHKLELDHDVKFTIQALVEEHSKNKKDFDDIISGKGQGLIFLLFGLPGLGKTLTAEVIAERSRKPLYAISSGELGTDVVQTDFELRRIFSRAKQWDAILLLDEADVFLAKRSKADLKRNAFVSIFLRLIEYYGGILFLTTNRADEFDEAFQSRIHLSIGYHPLTPARRTAIWRNLLADVQHEEWDETKWEKFGNEYEINGREIKNLIRTAVAIANFKKQALGEEHIRYVFDVNRKAQQAKLEMARLSAQTAS